VTGSGSQYNPADIEVGNYCLSDSDSAVILPEQINKDRFMSDDRDRLWYKTFLKEKLNWK